MIVLNSNRSSAPPPLSDSGGSNEGRLSFRARKQGACRELKGPAALVSPPSCQKTGNMGELRKDIKTRRREMEEDMRREEARHKGKGQKRAKKVGGGMSGLRRQQRIEERREEVSYYTIEDNKWGDYFLN